MIQNTKKLVSLILIMIFVFSMTPFALAVEITPYADTVFVSVTISLLTTEKASFEADTYEIQKSISVTACSLQKYVNGVWQYWSTLTPPSKVATNTFGYTAAADYSAYIGAGQYRIMATFNADGHEITRYSNSRTY